MSLDIETTEIGRDLRSAPDQIFAEQILTSTSTVSSGEFKLGNTMGGVEIKIVATTVHTLVAALTINLLTSAVAGGTKNSTLDTATVALGTVTAVGDVLYKFIAPRENIGEIYTQLDLVTTDNEAALKVDAYMVFVS
jgi:hypothetical protein